jgi:hypothetical protein
MENRSDGFFIDMLSKCNCGAEDHSQAKVFFQPISNDKMEGFWVIGQMVMPDEWKLGYDREPLCPVCAGVRPEVANDEADDAAGV